MSLYKNIVAIWSGFLGSIPANWQLCDGTNGTPDLRDRFVQGSQGSLAIGDTGGNANHSHSFTSDGHYHGLGLGTGLEFGDDFRSWTTIETDTGITDIRVNLPKYYALAFIMRMS